MNLSYKKVFQNKIKRSLFLKKNSNIDFFPTLKNIIYKALYVILNFLRKYFIPGFKSKNIRSNFRKIFKYLILFYQGNRSKLKKRILIFNFKELQRYGVQIKRNTIKSSFPKNPYSEIKSFYHLYESHEKVLKGKKPFKSGEALNNTFYFVRGKEFHEKDLSSKKYHGQDEGVIDIWNPEKKFSNDHWMNKIFLETRKIIEDSFNFSKKGINYTHSNLYIYKNVSTPRCLHVDSYKEQYKCFIPLNPCLDIKKGCYSYVPKSQKYPLHLLQIFSRFLNFMITNSDLGFVPSGDGTLFHIDTAIPILVNPGDLVVTSQKGIHGDFPSNKPIDRYVLVLNYTKGKWDFYV